MNKILTIFYLCFIINNLFGQNPWTLKDCISYAQQNNLVIKQGHLNLELSKENLFQSKMNLLPSINGGISDNTNYGRNIDPVTNEITIDRVRNNSFGLNSSITLFNGFQNLNTIKKNNYDYLASKYDSEKIANDISINIVTAYLQLLYSDDLVKSKKKKLEASEQQVTRISSMVEVGSLPKGDLLNAEAQKAQEDLHFVNAQNQRDIALLNLKQLLDIPISQPFEIVDPKLNIEQDLILIDTIDIYSLAIQNLPDVKSAELRLKSSKLSLAISRGARSPRLSASASIGTAYSDASKRFSILDTFISITPIYENYPFRDQFKDNVNQSISFNLTFPIFNNWQINSLIIQAQIGVANAKYNLQEAKNTLRKTIEQAYNDAVTSKKVFSK